MKNEIKDINDFKILLSQISADTSVFEFDDEFIFDDPNSEILFQISRRNLTCYSPNKFYSISDDFGYTTEKEGCFSMYFIPSNKFLFIFSTTLKGEEKVGPGKDGHMISRTCHYNLVSGEGIVEEKFLELEKYILVDYSKNQNESEKHYFRSAVSWKQEANGYRKQIPELRNIIDDKEVVRQYLSKYNPDDLSIRGYSGNDSEKWSIPKYECITFDAFNKIPYNSKLIYFLSENNLVILSYTEKKFSVVSFLQLTLNLITQNHYEIIGVPILYSFPNANGTKDYILKFNYYSEFRNEKNLLTLLPSEFYYNLNSKKEIKQTYFFANYGKYFEIIDDYTKAETSIFQIINSIKLKADLFSVNKTLYSLRTKGNESLQDYQLIPELKKVYPKKKEIPKHFTSLIEIIIEEDDLPSV